MADYYASVGKSGIEKATEGDQRTPLGVYFITSRLDPATLKDFYGAGALPINYPNPLDQSRARSAAASGCTARRLTSSRVPLATDGCVAPPTLIWSASCAPSSHAPPRGHRPEAAVGAGPEHAG